VPYWLDHKRRRTARTESEQPLRQKYVLPSKKTTCKALLGSLATVVDDQ